MHIRGGVPNLNGYVGICEGFLEEIKWDNVCESL